MNMPKHTWTKNDLNKSYEPGFILLLSTLPDEVALHVSVVKLCVDANSI